MQDIFVTKIGMTQAWNTAGKRIAVTRCKAASNLVVAAQESKTPGNYLITLGFGKKKLKNMKKPVRSQLAASGFTTGARILRGSQFTTSDEVVVPAVGSTISALDILSVGDVVKVQGTSKGKGYTGVVKRWGFHGGPKTHGQSDRTRAAGSIGAGTTPGRVYKGLKMAGHSGVAAVTVAGLVVVHVDQKEQEIWLSGPVPGAITSTLRIRKQGETKEITLDFAASNIATPIATAVEEDQTAEPIESTESTKEVAA